MTETQYGEDPTTDCHQVHIIPIYLKPNLLQLNRAMSTTTQRQTCGIAWMHARLHTRTCAYTHTKCREQ
jgi:hypothetical protein